MRGLSINNDRLVQQAMALGWVDRWPVAVRNAPVLTCPLTRPLGLDVESGIWTGSGSEDIGRKFCLQIHHGPDRWGKRGKDRTFKVLSSRARSTGGFASHAS
jgi:hypothetical protein